VGPVGTLLLGAVGAVGTLDTLTDGAGVGLTVGEADGTAVGNGMVGIVVSAFEGAAEGAT